ncbi:MAG: sugar phosphate isomerase/epimerase [Pseudomonadota bacterium]
MTDISYQLYSSRNFGPIGATLRMLAAAGYSGVEGYGGLFGDAATLDALKAALSDSGLNMPTAHIGLDAVAGDPAGVIATARDLGIEAVIVPFTDHQTRSAAAWAAFGAELAEAGKPLQDAGFAFGWHNHAFEFADLGGADRPLDLILQASDTMMFEFDIAWAVVAGEDPAIWIEKYADRLLAVHVKDRAPEGTTAEDGWADVGHGVINWAALTQAVQAAGARHLIIEHDNPADDHRFATRSIAALRGFLGDSA